MVILINTKRSQFTSSLDRSVMSFCAATRQLIHGDGSFNGELPWDLSGLFFNNRINPCCIECFKTCYLEDWIKLGIEETQCHFHLHPPMNFGAVKLFVSKIQYFRRQLFSSRYPQTEREAINLKISWFLSTEVNILWELEKENSAGKKFSQVWTDRHYLSYLRMKNAIFSISPIPSGGQYFYWANPNIWSGLY